MTFPSNVAPLTNIESCVVIGQCLGNRAEHNQFVHSFDIGVGATCASNAMHKVPIVDHHC